jgi:hypothetical protein
MAAVVLNLLHNRNVGNAVWFPLAGTYALRGLLVVISWRRLAGFEIP